MVKRLGFQTYLISYTGSMEPVLNYNDLIVIKKYDFNDLKVGDYISYLANTTNNEKIVITHEVYNIFIDKSTGTRYIETKGINVLYPDLDLVTVDGADDTSLYLGKYAFKSEIAGNMIAFFRSTNGIITLFINFSCMILILYILRKPKTTYIRF